MEKELETCGPCAWDEADEKESRLKVAGTTVILCGIMAILKAKERMAQAIDIFAKDRLEREFGI